MKVLDLFSGIGGFSLGLERAGMETVAFCEIEKYPRKVLKKHWPSKIIHRDVRTLNGFSYRGTIDIITGGFPCQDISVAGNQKGINAERSGLWSELCRIIGEVRPSYAIIENVTALLSGDNGRWFQRVLWDISQIGYDAEWHCIQPQDIGIPSIRDRVWIIAYPKKKHVAQVVDSRGLSFEPRRMGESHISKTRWSVDECRMGRGVDGVPDETYRFEGLGNAVVPQIPEIIGRAIMDLENEDM